MAKRNLNLLEKIVRKAAPLVAAVGISAMVLTGCSGVGPSPPKSTPTTSTPTKPNYTAEKTAIVNDANRLVAVQNADGGWDADITGQTGPDSATPSNSNYMVTGLAGQGMLDAYKVTKDQTYLNAAVNAGNYLVSSSSQGPFSVSFLQNLSKATGDSSYMDFANNNIEQGLGQGNPTITTGDVDALLSSAESNIGHVSGFLPWQFFKGVEILQNYGASSGYTASSSVIDYVASNLKAYVEQSGYDSNTPSFALGLASAILGLEADGMGYSTELSGLKSAQQSDGSFASNNYESGDGPALTTPFAVMALEGAGDSSDAYKGVQWEMNEQLSNGGWNNGGYESPGTDAANLGAIAKYINQ